jgi:dGTPase
MDADNSRGRRFPEPAHPYRNVYARDRDRVIHSRAFRRLEAKTQVFTTRYSDHFRNRLTHTIEVAQIARTVAEALGLNSDLAEALALVHDIGHPPFGHAGERKLHELMSGFGDGFDHNLQALHIVEHLEQRYLDFPGLNLTFEVREGIVKHSNDYDAQHFPHLSEYLLDQQPPLEAQLIDFVDEIAYDAADLDDGYEAKLLDIRMIRDGVPLFDAFYREVERAHPDGAQKLKFNEAIKRMLDHLATALVDHTRSIAQSSGAQSVEAIRSLPHRVAGFDPDIRQESARLKQFLMTRLYDNPAIVAERQRSVTALGQLFNFYLEHPQAVPQSFRELHKAAPLHRMVCDYVSGMTDHYLLQQHRSLLGAVSAVSTAN